MDRTDTEAYLAEQIAAGSTTWVVPIKRATCLEKEEAEKTGGRYREPTIRVSYCPRIANAFRDEPRRLRLT